MICSYCQTEVSEGTVHCPNCGRSLGIKMVHTQSSVQRPGPNPNVALILEILPGLLGFLGIGWMYIGRVGIGILLLIGWWIILGSVAFVGLISGVLTGGLATLCLCLWVPAQFIIPIVSGLMVRSEAEKR